MAIQSLWWSAIIQLDGPLSNAVGHLIVWKTLHDSTPAQSRFLRNNTRFHVGNSICNYARPVRLIYIVSIYAHYANVIAGRLDKHNSL